MAVRNCPITADMVQITESSDYVIVVHPKIGRYVLNADCPFRPLAADADARARMARWIEETSSLGIENSEPHCRARRSLRAACRPGGVCFGMAPNCAQAIKPEDEERLWRKLRLEWNYNSNHIEGNTLTYHETAMLFSLPARAEGGHPLRGLRGDEGPRRRHRSGPPNRRLRPSARRGRRKGFEQDPSQGAIFTRTRRRPDGRP